MSTDTSQPNTLDIERRGDAPPASAADALRTTLLTASHNVADFRCARSPRVQGFFSREGLQLIPDYCRAFVIPNPDDPTGHIWGYYTLSAALVERPHLSGTDERRASKYYLGFSPPMVRIGFMGRDDRVPKDLALGSALLVDAARRVHRNKDIAAWGLVLESEDGKSNPKLWNWYEANGFKACRNPESPNTVYAPLSKFIPELKR